MCTMAAVLFVFSMQAVPFTLEHLDLDLNVNYQAERIDGVARMTIRNNSTAPAGDVPLLLGRLMTIQNADGLAFEQDVLTFPDETKRQVDAAIVHLREPLAPGAAATIAIHYGGHIVGYTETGSLYIQDRVSEDFTIIRTDAYAFPVLGVLSRRDRKMRNDTFSYDAKITVPKGFIAAAGGLVDQQDADGRTRFHFATSERAPFLAISIAKFHVTDDNGIRIYALPADDAGAKVVAEKTKAAMALLTKWFGPLPHEPRVTIVEIPTMWGSQASLVSGIILTAETFQDPKWLFELYHELGHFWNPPPADNPSPRLNEGLSMWLQDVMSEALDQVTLSHGKGMTERTLKRAASDPRVQTVPLASYGKEFMTDWSYSVGCLYFYLLESALGRDAVLGVVRDWYQTYKEKGATLNDFTSLLEKRYPKAKAIDADWITSTAWLPKLEKAKSITELAKQY